MNLAELFQTLWLSVKFGILATLINLPLALGLVYFLARHPFKGKSLLEGIINLPLVMPPVTTGYILLILLGKRGVLGGILYDYFGFRIAFSPLAAVIAAMVVSFPLITGSIRISIDSVDAKLEKVASSLGAPRLHVFFRVTLPMILPGIINGAILGFARSLGEFGATMTFAGNISGETRTIPLAVFSKLQVPGKEKEAALLVVFSVFISLGAMFLSSLLNKRLNRRQTHGSGI